MRRCAKAAIASEQPFATRGFHFRRNGSRSASRPPICARSVQPSTCRSPWGFWRPAAFCPSASRTAPVVIGGLSLDGGVPAVRGLLPVAVAARQLGGALVHPERQPARGLDCRSSGALPCDLADGRGAGAFALPMRGRTSDAPGRRSRLPDTKRSWTCRTSAASTAAGAPSRSRPRAAITCCSPARPAPARRCWPEGCRGSCRRSHRDEALAVTTIHSVAGALPADAGLMRTRPFRAPHHTCSDVALVGGGSHPRPGELSLAHCGVLFLDELPEFPRQVLETLRQPLEQGVVHIARAARTVTFPAEVLLVGAMNPCPCGFHSSGQRPCHCPPGEVDRYRRRLSGPLRDRFDLSAGSACRAMGGARRRGSVGRGLGRGAGARHRGADQTVRAAGTSERSSGRPADSPSVLAVHRPCGPPPPAGRPETRLSAPGPCPAC